MRRLKKILQDNLSLSSKLFLRRVLKIIDPRRRETNQHSFETPVLTPADLDLAARLAESKPAAPVMGDERRVIRTSIVIPVFNKAEFTFQCIQSLLAEIDFNETEVIVVDNASTDETARVLAHFDNLVRTIRNEENRGFVDACNQGAAVARGKYLLFLNNDTVVLPGWLNYLIETIDASPETGAVGSMFLYPDGSIQEAGSIVWKDGHAHHYGWGASPDDRRFNFAREVDYCSAASLVIRKEIFERLGGFDRRFAPAYYEDIDLCFGVRSLGYKVIYQPMSRLVHYEGATAGRDVNKGFKHFQVINREKLVEKWRDVLVGEHFERDLKRVPAAAHRLLGPNILVFDERIPSPDRDAGSCRMYMILKALAQWSHVVFIPFNRPQSIEYEQSLWKDGIETAETTDYSRLLKARKVQAVILSRPTVAEALIARIRRANRKITIVFDMVDAHFIRLKRESQISGDAKTAQAAQSYQKLELRLARASDVVWCNSSEDKRVMESAVPGKKMEVVPTIHELHDEGNTFEERSDLLFIGNLAHRPNSDAVHFLMGEIYPLLRQFLPEIQLFIVGDNATAEILSYASDRIKVTGYVPDIEPLLQGCRVFIAPLRFGAGVKGKVGEAMSYALPVVTTTIGAEGFGLVNGFSALISDTAEDFAAAIVRLYSDKELWQSLAKNSRRQVAEHFTPEVIAETINNSIKEVSLSNQ